MKRRLHTPDLHQMTRRTVRLGQYSILSKPNYVSQSTSINSYDGCLRSVGPGNAFTYLVYPSEAQGPANRHPPSARGLHVPLPIWGHPFFFPMSAVSLRCFIRPFVAVFATDSPQPRYGTADSVANVIFSAFPRHYGHSCQGPLMHKKRMRAAGSS